MKISPLEWKQVSSPAAYPSYDYRWRGIPKASTHILPWFVAWDSAVQRWAVYRAGYAVSCYAQTEDEGKEVAEGFYYDVTARELGALEWKEALEWKKVPNADFWVGYHNGVAVTRVVYYDIYKLWKASPPDSSWVTWHKTCKEAKKSAEESYAAQMKDNLTKTEALVMESIKLPSLMWQDRTGYIGDISSSPIFIDLIWMESIHRWNVYMTDINGPTVRNVGYAKTVEEGKDMAEMAFLGWWCKHHPMEASAKGVVDRLLEGGME